MTPVTRLNITLEPFDIELLGFMADLFGSSKSEIIRRGLYAFWMENEKAIEALLLVTPGMQPVAASIRKSLAAKNKSGRARKK